MSKIFCIITVIKVRNNDITFGFNLIIEKSILFIVGLLASICCHAIFAKAIAYSDDIRSLEVVLIGHTILTWHTMPDKVVIGANGSYFWIGLNEEFAYQY